MEITFMFFGGIFDKYVCYVILLLFRRVTVIIQNQNKKL